MKDDIDNKLDQTDSGVDMEAPSIPAETEPDTTNANDHSDVPYGPSSESDTSEPNAFDASEPSVSDKPMGEPMNDTPASDDMASSTPASDQTDNTDKIIDPIADFNPDEAGVSDSSTQDNLGSPSSTTMPDFVAPAPAVSAKKTKRSKIVFGFLVIVLLLALGGFVYWYYYMQPTESNNTTPVATEPTETKTSLSYTDVIKDLTSDTPTKVADTFPNAKAFVVDDIENPAYKIGDSEFYVSTQGDNQSVLVQPDGDKKYSFEDDGIDVDDKYIESNKQITDSFVAYLTENGFKETQTADRDLPNVATVYTNDITVCSVSSNENPASATCTELANYTKDQATLAPIFTALQKDNKDIGATTTVLSTESTKTNESLGYENAVVNIFDVRTVTGGYAGLFYKKTADKDWTYFTGTQNILPCEDYKTYAQQAAFQGDPCGDGETVTVTADKPKQ